jgi:hypothetical protein
MPGKTYPMSMSISTTGNLLATDLGPLPQLIDRFGDVSLAGAGRLLKLEHAQYEMHKLLQKSIDAIAARLTPRPKKNIHISELLRRAIDKGDVEAKAVNALIDAPAWGDGIEVNFTADLRVPAFVEDKKAVALVNDADEDANPWPSELAKGKWTRGAVYGVMLRSFEIAHDEAAPEHLRRYAKDVENWHDGISDSKFRDDLLCAVQSGGCWENRDVLADEPSWTNPLDTIAWRLNEANHQYPPSDYFDGGGDVAAYCRNKYSGDTPLQPRLVDQSIPF